MLADHERDFDPHSENKLVELVESFTRMVQYFETSLNEDFK